MNIIQVYKLFLAVSLILNAKKGISARQLARDLEVNKSTAWRMGMQIRKAMAEGAQRQLLQGVVEMDETYVGGKPRKGGGGGAPKRGRGTRKTPVVGMIQRGGNVQARVVGHDSMKAKSHSALVEDHGEVQNAA